ncbi:transcription initiation factor TFIID subunit 1-like [Frieseomelitta varia]|uniref:transcription initiation factor TFIID subunit 1-like n=1 Tax=Frieseomelitta varia TaxID=561572 RepID=UPI001CB69912|nr:transcription initiation factor TFIID subunit 1-like [Frieseomelitta varia]
MLRAIDTKLKSPIEAKLFRPRSPLNLSSTAPSTRVDSTTTASNDDAYSRKRNRKRVTTGRDEESTFSSTENYPRGFPKVRGSANKSGRLRGSNFVESRKGNLEKFVDEKVASDGTRNVRGRNVRGNAARTGNTLELAGLSEKLHERENPANIKNAPLFIDLRKSDVQNPVIGDETSESVGDGVYKSSQTSEESGSFKEEVESSTNTNDLDNSVKEIVATSSSFESRRDDKVPTVAEHSPRSNSYVDRSSDQPATSTDSWTNEPGSNEQRSARTRNDGVAEATSVENGEEDGKYEKHEGRQVESHDLPSHEYVHENERAPEGVMVFKKDEDGRHAAKYDVRVEDDVASDGSHDTESHRSVKEGAAGRGKFEKGGATEREQEHRESDGEKGEKGYESWHEEEKSDKGHHDKEQRSNYYDEKDGKEKEQKEEGGYHEEHQEGEKGVKQADFDEKGEHQKGYNTKGQHFVHEKDEFEKRTEFFDEFHEDGDAENDGEIYHERKMSKGGHYKAGHHDADDHRQTFGKRSEYEKSDHHSDDKGHEVKNGEDSHHEQGNMHGEKKSHRGGKEWTHRDGADETDKKKH